MGVLNGYADAGKTALKKIATLIPFIFLAALAAMVYHPLLLRPGEISWGASSDLINLFLPRMLWAVDFFKSFGHVPRWDPYTYSGVPFIGNMQSPGFYPLNWPAVLMSADRFFNLYYVAHALLGGFFAYLFARRLGLGRAASTYAAAVYQTSGFFVAHVYAGHCVHLGNYPWLPLVALAVLELVRTRRLVWAGLAAAAGALQLLSGHPQFFLYSVTFAAAFALTEWIAAGRAKFVSTAALGALAAALLVGLSAVVLLPGIEFASLMENARKAPLGYSDSFSISGADVVRLAFGRRIGFDKAQLPAFWESCGFAGMLTLPLAFAGAWFGRRRRVEIFLAAAAIIAVLFSMGPEGGVYYFFYYVIPGYGTFRAPGRMLMVFTLAAGLLAGFGLDGFARLTAPRAKAAAVFALALAAGAAVLFVAMRGVYWAGGAWGDFIWAFSQPATLIAAGLSAAATLAAAARARGATAFAIAVVAFDLGSFAGPLIQTRPIERILYPSKIVKAMASNAAPFRVILETDSLMLAQLSAARIETVQNSYDASTLGHFESFMRGRRDNAEAYTDYCRLLNVRYLISRGAKAAPGFERILAELPAGSEMPNVLYRFTEAMPRAFVVGRTRRLPEGKVLVSAMRELEATREAYVENDAALLAGEPSCVPARIGSYNADEMTVEVELDRPGYLVISQIWHPGWKLYDQNGKAVPVFRTDGALLGTPLGSGAHRLRVVYDPAGIRIGRIVTLASMVLLVAVFAAGFVQIRRESRAPPPKAVEL